MLALPKQPAAPAPTTSTHAVPLVSVIIPCYNQGHYLSDAIESVYRQAHSHVEIIVVDDGSADNTREVAAAFPQVRYVYQSNQGLSAARNTGIEASSGDFLVFLDADDLLINDNIPYNLELLTEQPEAAFVSGGYIVVNAAKQYLSENGKTVASDHFLHLLRDNYIGMHATVMFRRNAFDQVRFDTTLKSAEDYDVYLQLARHHPVLHHTRRIAAYRRHNENMSANIPRMLELTVEVLERRRPALRTDAERQALNSGIRWFRYYYTRQLEAGIRQKKLPFAPPFTTTLRKHGRKAYLKLLVVRLLTHHLPLLKIAPPAVLRLLFNAGVYKNFTPATGRVRWGDLNRMKPLSVEDGTDRGGAIALHYIQRFLTEEADLIKGRVLQVGNLGPLPPIDTTAISQLQHIEPESLDTQAGRLPEPGSALAVSSFDCILLCQSLAFVYDYRAALVQCHRLLKPGGVLLLTVPAIAAAVDLDAVPVHPAFTMQAMENALSAYFPKSSELQFFGNLQVVTASLYGMGCGDLPAAVLAHKDAQFPLVITAKARKVNTDESR